MSLTLGKDSFKETRSVNIKSFQAKFEQAEEQLKKHFQKATKKDVDDSQLNVTA